MSDFQTFAGSVVLLAAVLTALGVLLRKAYQAFKMGETAFIQLVGTKDEPSLRQAMATLASEVASVKKELHPNSGSSMRDELRQVQHDVTNVRAGQDLLLQQVDGATSAAARAAQRAEDTARHVEVVAEKQRADFSDRLTQMRGDIAQDAADRTAGAFELLAERTASRTDGPIDLRGEVLPHTHALPERDAPTLTSGPVPLDEETP